MLETLLVTKLYYPPVRPNLVARPRLTQQLAQVTSGALTLVCAPAGYGKTTLVATGLAPLAQEQAVAWLSLDEDDNDPACFWTYVIAALRTIAPDIGKQALTLLQSPQPAAASLLLTLLINDMAVQPAPFVLVLDDYHIINAPPIHEGLAFLVEHLPPQAHLVLTSRIDPPLPLSRLRARGSLIELRAAELRFTPEEAAAFLQEVMGCP